MTSVKKSNHKAKVRGIIALLFATLLIQIAASSSVAVASSALYHSVTFVENDSPSDPIYASQSENVQTALTSFANLSPSFVNSGYSFEDWNTSPDGSGTSYADGTTYGFAASETLYATWTSINHSVTFVENDNPSDPIYSSQSANVPSALALFANLDPKFSDFGYSFVEWNTESSGTGTAYTDGSTFSFSESIFLYAIWSPILTTTLSFESIGGTGSIESISNQVGQFTTLPSGSGFSNPGFTFTGWNTKNDGSGTEYVVGATYVFAGNQTLYAQWSPDTYLVTYSYGGGVAIIGSSNFVVGTAALILPTPTFTGSTFDGWFNAESGGTLVGVGGASYVPNGSIQLFAQWTPNAIEILTFNSNGGTGSITSVSADYGTTVVLPTIDGISYPGFAFNGWNTKADGSGTHYTQGVGLSLDSSETLYAQWTAGLDDIVSFNANGGSGSINPISGTPGSTIRLPDQNGLIHEGFKLTSWNTSANGAGTSFQVGQSFNIAGSISLYAQWSGERSVTLFGAIGTFNTDSSSLSANLKSQINRVALTIKSRKYLTIDLFGYSATTGLKSLNISLSRSRAIKVGTYLRSRLRALKVRGVRISSSGQGSIAGQSSKTYSRVEVFGV